ncbi:MAG: serine/threonine-protein kinase [Planctomycetota bacterium]
MIPTMGQQDPAVSDDSHSAEPSTPEDATVVGAICHGDAPSGLDGDSSSARSSGIGRRSRLACTRLDLDPTARGAALGPSSSADVSPGDSEGLGDSGSSVGESRSRYERLEELGRGGCGVVDRAVDRQLGREVAVKRFFGDTDEDKRKETLFLNEAKITSQLQHPGVVPVHEFGCDDQQHYYVMKLLDGDTLRKHIRGVHAELHAAKKSPTPYQLRLAITPLLERFIDVCQAIAYAHSQCVLHRDLKPANVVVGAFGETVVLDWGLARQQDAGNEQGNDPSPNVRLQGPMQAESDGTIAGTPAYMSPEQAQGLLSTMDHRSDIYSLGVVLFEIVAGKHPYQGKNVDQILDAVRSGVRPALNTTQSSAPRALCAIVDKATRPETDQRYASAQQIADDVRAFIADQPVSVYRENLVDRSIRWCRRNRSMAATIAASIFILLIASILFGIVIHRAHQDEQLARQAAETAHQNAMTRLIDAHETADAWLIDLSGSLRYYPGMAAIREDLLQQAITQYESLTQVSIEQTLKENLLYQQDESYSTLVRNDIARLERAKCYLRLADLYRLQGQSDESAERLRLANRLLGEIDSQSTAQLSTRDRTRPHVTIRKVGLSSNLGSDAVYCSQLANLERVSLLTGMLAIDQTPDPRQISFQRRWLAATLPADPARSAGTTLQRKAASALVRLEVMILRNRPARRERDLLPLAEAVSWAAWLVDRRGAERDRHLLETAHTDLARGWQSIGRLTQALQTWTELIECLRDDVADQPERPDFLQSLAQARLQRAAVAAVAKHADAAERDYRDAIDELRAAWKLSDGDAFYRVKLETAQRNLAELNERS